MDLSTRVVKGEKYIGPSAHYTDDEIQQKLDGYVNVPQDQWESIKVGIHVRYIGKDGKFRLGGFVVLNPRLGNPDEHGMCKRYILLRSSINPKDRRQWMADYENISQMYVKLSQEYICYVKPLLDYHEACIRTLHKKIIALERYNRNDDMISDMSKLSL